MGSRLLAWLVRQTAGRRSDQFVVAGQTRLCRAGAFGLAIVITIGLRLRLAALFPGPGVRSARSSRRSGLGISPEPVTGSPPPASRPSNTIPAIHEMAAFGPQFSMVRRKAARLKQDRLRRAHPPRISSAIATLLPCITWGVSGEEGRSQQQIRPPLEPVLSTGHAGPIHLAF
jgi:hypothetical protein